MTRIRTLADVQRLENEPRDLPASTYAMIQAGAALDPSAPALSFFLRVEDHAQPERWSYRALLKSITQAANAFHTLGADKSSVIAYVLPNLPETHFSLWGGQAAGIVMPVNPLLEPNTIAALLTAANASILVTLAPFPGTDLWTKLQRVLGDVPSLRHVVLVNMADRVRGPKRVLAKLLQKREVMRLHGARGVRSPVSSAVKVHDFWTLLKREPGDRLRSGRVISPDDTSSYFCTGGTTGLPKIARRLHSNEVFNAWSVALCLGGDIGAGRTLFCGLPLFHVNAVLATGLVPFSRGAHVLLGTPQGFRGPGVVARFWEIVARHKVYSFSGVPTLYASLLAVPMGEHRVDSLGFAICGAAPMPVEVFRTFEKRTGVTILEGYGLTEGTCVSSVNPAAGERRLGSIGLRIPGQQMKAVVLDEKGQYVRDCASDEGGQILISGPNVFAGYLSPEQNKRVFIELGDGARWLDTGDLGRCDEEGYFWLTGRKKELIIRGGHNIDPGTIEEPLHRHPVVQLAAAVGRPDAHAGELPVAYVQLKPGLKATEGELLAFLQGEIVERAAMPKAIHIIAEMPLTAVGKIFKPSLKRKEIANALSQALRTAEVGFEQLDVADDPSRGTTVQVRLSHVMYEAAATSVLGAYAFPFTLSYAE